MVEKIDFFYKPSIVRNFLTFDHTIHHQLIDLLPYLPIQFLYHQVNCWTLSLSINNTILYRFKCFINTFYKVCSVNPNVVLPQNIHIWMPYIFSSWLTCLPAPLNIIPVLECSVSPRIQTCKVHCLLSNPEAVWLILFSPCLLDL